MSNSVKTYPDEFKKQAVSLVRDGKSVPEVAKELGVNKNTLYGWVSSHKGEKVMVSDEAYAKLQRENNELRKENNRLKEERTILKKAAAYFALETV